MGAALLATLSGAYFILWRTNIVPQKANYFFYIPTGSSYADVEVNLQRSGMVRDLETFRMMAGWVGYANQVKPGRYAIPASGLSNYDLLSRLRRGLQSPLQLTIAATRTTQDLCKHISKQLELPADSFQAVLDDEAYVLGMGFTPETVMAMFLPNSYEVYWNVKPRTLMKRMRQEYLNYWNDSRKAKAKELNLTPMQVSILASIVEAETYRDEERARVAGVYVNRLKRGMHLQADPTVIFANRDFTIRRVLNRHLQIDSPYNTYKYTGLPPGPINCPSRASLEAVLNAEQHAYIYFVAKADFSGYHTFAQTLAQHEQNANQYRIELSRQQRIAAQRAAAKAAGK